MACCNPHRVKAGLVCDIGQQLACAQSRLIWTAEYAPEHLSRLLDHALHTFPEHLAHLRVVAKRIDALDSFVQATAMQCAALSTKTERRAYRAQIETEMSATELDQFDQIMAVEWSRLRGRSPERNK